VYLCIECCQCQWPEMNISHYSFLLKWVLYKQSRYSSVGIATGYKLDGRGIESRWGMRFSAPVQTGPGVHPASYTVGTGSLPGIKQLGRGIDHPPPSSTEVKERVECTLVHLWAFVACYRVSCTFTFTFYCISTQSYSIRCRLTEMKVLMLILLQQQQMLKHFWLQVSWVVCNELVQ
jgi:hypothetical protein